jgi:hypothetical protein
MTLHGPENEANLRQMDIQQKLSERKKELAENEKALQHYRGLHDKLSLEDVE